MEHMIAVVAIMLRAMANRRDDLLILLAGSAGGAFSIALILMPRRWRLCAEIV